MPCLLVVVFISTIYASEVFVVVAWNMSYLSVSNFCLNYFGRRNSSVFCLECLLSGMYFDSDVHTSLHGLLHYFCS